MQAPAVKRRHLQRSVTYNANGKARHIPVGPLEMLLLLKMVSSSAVILLEFSKSVVVIIICHQHFHSRMISIKDGNVSSIWKPRCLFKSMFRR